MSSAAMPAADEKTLLGHPRGLFVLFFSELWERFSYYGMRALLTLYMVKQLHWSDEESAAVYGAYTGLVYLFPVVGGYLADRVLGFRKAIILGGLLMAAGHALMAIEHPSHIPFYCALAFLCVGNGFFKPNISSTVGKLYEPGDQRRDSGFTIFYMGINAGALLAPLVCGPLGEKVGWHWGFGAATIGMLLGLGIFVLGRAELRGKGEASDAAVGNTRVLGGVLNLNQAIVIGSFLLIPLVALIITEPEVAKYMVMILGLGVFGILIMLGIKEGRIALDRIVSLLILMVFHMAFWAFFEQAGSSLTLFADRVVERDVPLFGVLPASTFQGVNPFFIITFAPLFSALWTMLAKRGKQPSIPIKFALGLLQLGLGYGVLVLGMSMLDDGGKVLWIFLVLMYLLHTTGELCISPVGLSAVTKLAPPAATGFVMGAWFLSISGGNFAAAEIAKLTEVKFERGSALEELTNRQFAFGIDVVEPGEKADPDATPLEKRLQDLRWEALSTHRDLADVATDADRQAILASLEKAGRWSLTAMADGEAWPSEEGTLTFGQVIERLEEGGTAAKDVVRNAWERHLITRSTAEDMLENLEKRDAKVFGATGFKLGDGNVAPSLENLERISGRYGDELEQAIGFSDVIGRLGEWGIDPETVIAHAERRGMLGANAASKMREVIAAQDGLRVTTRTVDEDEADEIVDRREAMIEAFIADEKDAVEASDAEALLKDLKAPQQVRDAGVAESALGTFVVSEMLPKYQPVYRWLFFAALGIAALLFVISPFVRKLMHGVE